jgi:hypothetical protein
MKLHASPAAVTPSAHPSPRSLALRSGPSNAVSIEELLALRQLDLVVPPELAGELQHPAMHAPVGGDHLRLGPPPLINAEPAEVRRAVGGIIETFERRRSLPAQASANGAVSEAKMIAVLAQLHRLQLEITAAARKVA